MQQNWNIGLSYPSAPFGMISQVLAQVVREKVNHLIIVTLVWHTQPWYAQLPCTSKNLALANTKEKYSCESIEANASSDKE